MIVTKTTNKMKTIKKILLYLLIIFIILIVGFINSFFTKVDLCNNYKRYLKGITKVEFPKQAKVEYTLISDPEEEVRDLEHRIYCGSLRIIFVGEDYYSKLLNEVTKLENHKYRNSYSRLQDINNKLEGRTIKYEYCSKNVDIYIGFLSDNKTIILEKIVT